MDLKEMSKNYSDYLKVIDEVIAKGKYKDNWESLANYPIPKWYTDAKFGIFVGWGVYSVPAFGNEWYAHTMYKKECAEYSHHIEKYGSHEAVSYTDFVKDFKGEKFDADEWIKLFKKAGAKFVMPIAEHHDGFQMYNSDLSDWCAAKKGPKKDILGEVKKAAEENGLVFCTSNHYAEHYWFFEGMRDMGLITEEYVDPYGFCCKQKDNNDPNAPHMQDHAKMWLVRNCEIVDKYRPKIMWFDWSIQDKPFKPYIKKFAAYYYNRAAEWGEDVAINYKFDAFALGSAVYDVERGKLAAIRPRFWQTDTSIAKNAWCYTENNDFKDPADLICDLIDIVSKNGALLLNVGPKSDGTITQEETNILLEIGAWLEKNGEAVYGTDIWHKYGEGPTEITEGSFGESNIVKYTPEDIRFTYKAPYIYATVLSWPENGEVVIKSLGTKAFNAFIQNVTLLGYNNSLTYDLGEDELKIHVNGKIDTRYPVCFKIEIE